MTNTMYTGNLGKLVQEKHFLNQITTRGKCRSRIKAWFLYFSPNFSTQMNVSLPFESHNVAYKCKGLDQSNIVCEYEVNLLINDKSYYRNPKL